MRGWERRVMCIGRCIVPLPGLVTAMRNWRRAHGLLEVMGKDAQPR